MTDDEARDEAREQARQKRNAANRERYAAHRDEVNARRRELYALMAEQDPERHAVIKARMLRNTHALRDAAKEAQR